MGSVKATRAYRNKYNKDPPKCSRFVDGAVRDVNGYTDQDWDMIACEIKEYVEGGFE